MNKDFIKKLILPISYIVMGILFCIFKSSVSEWICRVIGIIVTVYGTINLVQDIKNKNFNLYLSSDIIMIGLGVLTIVLSFVIVGVINILLGIVFIIYAVYKIGVGQMVRNFSYSSQIISFIDGVLYLVIGILLIVNSPTVYVILGGILIAAGIIDFIQIMMSTNCVSYSKKESKHDAIDVEARVVDEEDNK